MAKLLAPEPDTAVRPKRAEPVPSVADIPTVYPYSGEDICKLCGKSLSRYNPHVICYGCVERVRAASWKPDYRAKAKELLDTRRHRNPKFPGKQGINARLFEKAGMPGYTTGGHRPQHGHS